MSEYTMPKGRPMYAHLRISRLCGVNLKVRVEYIGKSVYVPAPDAAKHYRVNREKFLDGDFQLRDSWVIRPWTEESEKRAEAEKDWMD